MHYSGRQFHLEHGSYAATVTEVGASLRELSHRGRPLIAGYAEDEMMPIHRGAVLVPWPNRLAGGRYEFDGRAYELPRDEPGADNAIHGLVGFAPFTVAEHAADAVLLRHRLWPRPGYPFLLDVEVGYRLTGDGLDWRVAVTNSGDRTAPYGCSVHPYLVAGPAGPAAGDGAIGRIDDWTLQVPAGRVVRNDDRSMPEDVVEVTAEQDFRVPRRIAGQRLDAAYTGIEAAPDGTAAVTLVDEGGVGVALTWGGMQWLQVYTSDRPGTPYDRVAVAVEPMTCPANAYNNGWDLIRLAPGERDERSWRIAAVG